MASLGSWEAVWRSIGLSTLGHLSITTLHNTGGSLGCCEQVGGLIDCLALESSGGGQITVRLITSESPPGKYQKRTQMQSKQLSAFRRKCLGRLSEETSHTRHLRLSTDQRQTQLLRSYESPSSSESEPNLSFRTNTISMGYFWHESQSLFDIMV